MNPFLTNIVGFDGERIEERGADDRVRMIESFNIPQCEAALRLPDIQKTVRRALERRLRKLNREVDA